MDKNQQIWDSHYTRPRAHQLYPDENIVRVLKKTFAQPTQNSWALDLGSGSGRHLPLLREHFTHTVACDFALTSLKLYTHENRGELQCALPETPFADASFDFILCWGVLHYLKEEILPQAIGEIQRILKPGGRLFLTLRSDADTHLESQLRTGDLKEGHAKLFSKSAALTLIESFAQNEYGFISRQPLGEDYLVAHHMILATR